MPDDHRHAGAFTQRLERPANEIVPADDVAGMVDEHKMLAVHRVAVHRHLRPVLVDRVHHVGRNLHKPIICPGFGVFTDDRPVPVVSQRPGDPDPVLLPVDIRPEQRQGFALPHPSEHHQGEQCEPPMALYVMQELLSLFRGPNFQRPFRNPRIVRF